MGRQKGRGRDRKRAGAANGTGEWAGAANGTGEWAGAANGVGATNGDTKWPAKQVHGQKAGKVVRGSSA